MLNDKVCFAKAKTYLVIKNYYFIRGTTLYTSDPIRLCQHKLNPLKFRTVHVEIQSTFVQVFRQLKFTRALNPAVTSLGKK